MIKKVKSFIPALILVSVIILIILIFIAILNHNNKKTVSATLCTQETKQCTDGSFVSHTGLNCEFAPCQNETTPQVKIVGGKCEYDKITGNCDVLSVSPDNTVKFNFSSTKPLPNNPLTKNLIGIHSDTLDIVNNRDILIKVGDKINCEANIETKGTCTPIIFKFLEKSQEKN